MYYAVAKGFETGIFTSWDECKTHVSGYSGAIYKKFKTESEAKQFIEENTKQDNNTDKTNNIADADYYVYTDGACVNNGRPSAIAGYGVYFGEGDARNVSKKIDDGPFTNNRAELEGVLCALKIIASDLDKFLGMKICIVTDSEYVLKCVGSYGDRLSKKINGFVGIPNSELVKQVYLLSRNVMFMKVKAHTDETDIHSVGNRGADLLANMAIGLENCPYAS